MRKTENGGEAYFPDTKTATKVYAPIGSVWSKTEFSCDVDTIRAAGRINHIYPGDTKEYSASGGRSSEERAPFFNVHKDGEGYILALGWTGQWKYQISRANDSVTFRSKIEDTFFRLLPGEKIRTSSVVIMPYKCDVADSHNKWRRLVKEHFSLIGKEGRDQNGPLCAGIWGGMKTQSVLDRIELLKRTLCRLNTSGWTRAGTVLIPIPLPTSSVVTGVLTQAIGV